MGGKVRYSPSSAIFDQIRYLWNANKDPKYWHFDCSLTWRTASGPDILAYNCGWNLFLTKCCPFLPAQFREIRSKRNVEDKCDWFPEPVKWINPFSMWPVDDTDRLTLRHPQGRMQPGTVVSHTTLKPCRHTETFICPQHREPTTSNWVTSYKRTHL